jgi:hypothetical protein
MSNPTLDLVHAHGSIRAYKPDPLPDAQLLAILLGLMLFGAQSFFVFRWCDRRARGLIDKVTNH